MDRMRVYDIIYALAACGGREDALFGRCFPASRVAFARSLPGDAYPELWFELPLAGEPWFDVHALAARESLDAQEVFTADVCGGVPEVFEWFAAQGPDARQLALSWDVGSGAIESPAVQLLKRTRNIQMTCNFLEVAGRPDAIRAYRAFEEALPQGWFACYAGVFPARTVPFLRVECIPDLDLQRSYANDPGLLAEHLRKVGLIDCGDMLLQRCRELAETPFRLEFQFDVTPEGVAGPTFSASLRFSKPSDSGMSASFDADGAAGDLMLRVQEWGLADDRWRLLENTVFSKRLKAGGKECLIWCYPAFLKLRWRGGEPIDAKAYLIAGAE